MFIVAYHSKYFKRNYLDCDVRPSGTSKPLWEVVNKKTVADEAYYLDPSNKYYQMIRKLADVEGADRLYQVRRVEIRACPTDTCPTLTANMGGGGHNVPFVVDDWGIRKLTEVECLALQGYNEMDVIFPPDILQKDKYTMIGNAIYPGIAEKLIKEMEFSWARGK